MLTTISEGPLTILVFEWVTGGGMAGKAVPPSWANEGSAMCRAIAADFAAITPPPAVRVIVMLDDRLSGDHGPWTIERVAAGESIERLRQMASSADFTVLIAPETTGILAQLTRELEEAGVRILGSSAGAVELTGDKLRLAAHLEHAGIATPHTRSVTPPQGLPHDAKYPAVLKPVDGAGSLQTYVVPNPSSIPTGARALPVAVLQPLLPGVPMSASFLVGPANQAYLIGIGAQRMAICNSRFVYRGGIIPISCPGALAQLEPAIAAVEGLRGFVGIDFLWQSQERHATVLEINARPTTSYVGLSRLLGPGILARAWLDLYDTASSEKEKTANLTALAERIDRQAPVSFDASGSFLNDGDFSG
jgi:predicted ATP-grasp superfamily ATP-dependent carboligase